MFSLQVKPLSSLRVYGNRLARIPGSYFNKKLMAEMSKAKVDFSALRNSN